MVKRARVRAPELVGRGGWINTGDRELSLAALRGRIVVLDFWTFCCVNCLHALDELRELEERHRDSVVIVGVHSPKFAHEAEHRAVLDAVERYGVEHPVLDDPERATWRQYAVRAWPTLAVIDPEGYVVAQYTGEGHAPAIQRLVEELETRHAAKGTLRRGDAPYVAPEPEPTTLRFPGKAVSLSSGTFLVSDTTRHQLVELAEDGESPVRRIGSGSRGFKDGPSERAEFSEPQGLALLGDGSVVVADTVNHALRRYEPVTGEVTTLAGTGRQRRPGEPARGAARAVSLSSPWDVALWNGRVWIAMAGVHQLWAYDPRDGSITVAAGTGNEGLVDGPGPEAWFAQPSGLSATQERLWVADSETSALRWVELDGTVRTAVGTGLFDFGLRDGPAARALLQHPLGVTALPDGSVVVADTYNHALRRYAPPTGEVSTLATDLREPSDAVVVGDDILVVESARHRLTRLQLPQDALGAAAGEGVRVETTEVASGTLRLEVAFRSPDGQKLDLRYGPATRLLVSATPPELLRAGAGGGTDLSRSLDLDPAVPEGLLHVSATAASCDDDPDIPYPACHVHQKEWTVPVRLVEGANDRLRLVLTGVDAA
ncbi:redoxin domain-containing protein [Streptomyces sp. SID10362]|uniref:NHL domain-containing thioredoxin family protein n=1 Tax=Streptomyces sp. SID10362 TaxID=2706021 RepID=UPI0013C64228|nr:NHL domain-containing thioredoxin family protein [Streptomyces sp. SID10362]NDZ70507.1 redoxin domain-containing protein [Streptomyces sp. SID10362]